MIHKLKRAERIQELNPSETPKGIGLIPRDTFRNIGAGTGISTFTAAELTENKVYAVKIFSELLGLLYSKRDGRKTRDVILENGVKNVPGSSCDATLLCTVFHKLEKPDEMLEKIRRILRLDGTSAIIEFFPKPTQFGLPPECHWGLECLEEQLTAHSFRRTALFELGENLYTLTCQTWAACECQGHRSRSDFVVPLQTGKRRYSSRNIEERLKRVEPKRRLQFGPFLYSTIEQNPCFNSILEQICLACFFRFPYNEISIELIPCKVTCRETEFFSLIESERRSDLLFKVTYLLRKPSSTADRSITRTLCHCRRRAASGQESPETRDS